MVEKLKTTLTPGFVFSQSSLQDYADCPRRFQLRYLEQLHWPAVESQPVQEFERHQQEGQLFHRLVQQALLGLPPEQLERLANSPELSRWWDSFCQFLPQLEGFELHPEIILSAPVGDYRVLAKYDLVAVGPDGRFLIYDWKTYRKKPRAEYLSARWQTRVYRALLVQAGMHLNGGNHIPAEMVEMIYWLSNFPTEPVRLKYTPAQYKRDWGVIEKVVSEIAAASEFPLTEDLGMCRYCTYRSYCERGVEAGTLEQAEVELESDAYFDIDFEQIGEIEF